MVWVVTALAVWVAASIPVGVVVGVLLGRADRHPKDAPLGYPHLTSPIHGSAA